LARASFTRTTASLPIAENASKSASALFSPEDFFDAKIRVAKLDEARDLMNESFGPWA
jgi:hypothetical protein